MSAITLSPKDAISEKGILKIIYEYCSAYQGRCQFYSFKNNYRNICKWKDYYVCWDSKGVEVVEIIDNVCKVEPYITQILSNIHNEDIIVEVSNHKDYLSISFDGTDHFYIFDEINGLRSIRANSIHVTTSGNLIITYYTLDNLILLRDDDNIIKRINGRSYGMYNIDLYSFMNKVVCVSVTSGITLVSIFDEDLKECEYSKFTSKAFIHMNGNHIVFADGSGIDLDKRKMVKNVKTIDNNNYKDDLKLVRYPENYKLESIGKPFVSFQRNIRDMIICKDNLVGLAKDGIYLYS
jgi:hypothetical protein